MNITANENKCAFAIKASVAVILCDPSDYLPNQILTENCYNSDFECGHI